MTEPIIAPPTSIPAVPTADISAVVSGGKEQQKIAEIRDNLKPSEEEPNISPEVSQYIQKSEPPVPDKEIIKASGESVPVSISPKGVVKLPEIPEIKQAEIDLKLGPNVGKAWEGMETIREIGRDELEVLRARIKELQEAEKAA